MTKSFNLVSQLFKDEEGKPVLLTENQLKIFDLIFKKQHHRTHLMAHTRYGKSFVVALAVLLRIATFPEKWAIVAPSEKQAKIIMGYIIDHTFDNEYTKSKLEISKDESLEHLRRERSKNRLVYKHSDGTYGEVFVISADNRNKQKAGDALMGFGAPNVIEDEAALIDDDIEGKVFRMLGDKEDNYYFKIGNPFRRNHFFKDSISNKFYKLNIDCNVALTEETNGASRRVNQEFLDEAKKKPHFSVLYENKFPDVDAVDDKGWSFLITDKEYENAMDLILPNSYIGTKILGHDVAVGGGNSNVWIMRCGNYAKIIGKNQDPDLMSTTGQTIRLARENGIDMRNVWIDDTGVGEGEVDRLREQRFFVNPVKVGEKASDDIKFFNKRAESYWALKEWLNRGGKLCSTDDWSELRTIKYKADSSGRLQIMPKLQMKKDFGWDSPDVADALMLAFSGNPYIPEVAKLRAEEDKNFNQYDVI